MSQKHHVNKKEIPTWKKKLISKRKDADRRARIANSPNGGCFHSSRWIRNQQHKEKELRKSIRENGSKCTTRIATQEEIEAMLNALGIKS